MCTYYYTPLGEDKFSGDFPSYQLTRSPGNICSIRPTYSPPFRAEIHLRSAVSRARREEKTIGKRFACVDTAAI